MTTWIYTFAALLGVSLLSFIAAGVLLLRRDIVRPAILVLISFSVGALLGDALIHILPELTEDGGLTAGMSFLMLAGIGGFFVLEKFLHWHHAHIASEDVLHPLAVTNLVGDAIHNFVDGVIIAAAFLANVPLGVATTLAVALHEIPQEIGDLSILLHAGLEARRALLLNFVSALFAVAGGALTLILAGSTENLSRSLLAITAGGFIYIAGADLIPELHRETRLQTSVLQFVGIAAGIAVMGLLLLVE